MTATAPSPGLVLITFQTGSPGGGLGGSSEIWDAARSLCAVAEAVASTYAPQPPDRDDHLR